MRPTILLLFSIMLFSCNSKKETASKSNNCPSDGVCSIEVSKSKALKIIDNSDTGIYYQLTDSDKTSVITYKFDRNKDESLYDGHYQEEIIFEISNKMLEANFKDFTPNNKLFGVHCYCKGKAGYYALDKLSVSYEKSSNTLSFSLNEVIENQVIKTVKIKL
jgi:hypothetical protein